MNYSNLKTGETFTFQIVITISNYNNMENNISSTAQKASILNKDA